MRRSKQATAESRQAILDVASRLFREHGFDGVGIADVMAACGMTHGGFYRHFTSKEALAAAAIAHAFQEKVDLLQAEGRMGPRDAVRVYIGDYLSRGHLAQPQLGCPIATLGSQAAHAGPSIAQVFSAGTEQLINMLSAAFGDEGPDARPSALRLLSTLVGALVMARAAGSSDLQDEILNAMRADPLVRGFTALPPQA
jgi:TetR/AcrR family transcriptional regulator, transcriptional repressor for nem operon